VLLTAASPWVAFLSTALMSETLFAAILTAGLLVLTRLHQGNGTRFDAPLAGLLAGLAVLTRTVGIAPALAGFLVLMRARRWKQSAQYLATLAALVAPWFVWVRYQTWAADAVDAYYSASNYGSWNIVASYDWQEKFEVIVGNAIYGGLVPAHIWGIPLFSTLVALLFAAACLACLGWGLWQARGEPAAVLVAAYCALIAAWVWPPLRFAIPVLPVLLWLGFLGSGRSRRFAAVVAAILLGLGTLHVSEVAKQASQTGTAWPGSGGVEDWHKTFPLLTWISENTPKDAVIVGNLDPTYYLFTGRKSVRAFESDPFLLYYNLGRRPGNPLGTLTDFRERLLAINAAYLILTPSEAYRQAEHLRSLISELSGSCAGCLTVADGAPNSGYVIYSIDRNLLSTHAHSSTPR
jgi:hypothetical protein